MKKRIFTLLCIGMSISAFCQAPSYTAQSQLTPYAGAWAYAINSGYLYAPNPGLGVPGYLNGSYTNKSAADLAKTLNSKSYRLGEYSSNLNTNGVTVDTSDYNYYSARFTDMACFLEGPSGNEVDHTTYNIPTDASAGTPGSGLIFANLYNSTNGGNIWNSSDGSVDTANYYARYVKHYCQNYGSKIKFFEVWNEPDAYRGSGHGITDTISIPPPQDMYNLYAPLSHYIRMLRITYEVVHHYFPATSGPNQKFVVTGGIGFPPFLQALLKYTDNPGSSFDGDPAKGAYTVSSLYPKTAGAYIDVVSFHNYPGYSTAAYNGVTGRFDLTFNSDTLCASFFQSVNALNATLAKYGYGTTYPAKQLMWTETDMQMATAYGNYATPGTPEVSRNYAIKIMILSQLPKYKIIQGYYYSLANETPLPNQSAYSQDDPNSVMGHFYYLQNNSSLSQCVKTPSGLGQATMSGLLYGYAYDNTKTTALNLPANIRGAAFTSGGVTRYCLWAVTKNQRDEIASTTYTFPSGVTLSKTWNWEAAYAPNNAILSPASYPYQSLSGNTVILTGTPQFFQ